MWRRPRPKLGCGAKEGRRYTSYEAPHYAMFSPQYPVLELPQFMEDQFPHPYRTTGKIIVFYILIFDIRWEG